MKNNNKSHFDVIAIKGNNVNSIIQGILNNKNPIDIMDIIKDIAEKCETSNNDIFGESQSSDCDCIICRESDYCDCVICKGSDDKSEDSVLIRWYNKNSELITKELSEEIDILQASDAANRTYMEDHGYLLKHVKELIERSQDKMWTSVLENMVDTLERVENNILVSPENRILAKIILSKQKSLIDILNKEMDELMMIHDSLGEDEISDFLSARGIINSKYEISTKFAEKLLA